MRVLRYILMIIVLAATLATPVIPRAAAQGSTTVGREFRFAYSPFTDQMPMVALYLYISSAVDTNGLIDFGNAEFPDVPFTVTAGETTIVELPYDLEYELFAATATVGISDRSIRVTAEHNITLYSSWFMSEAVDAFLIPPTSAGGTFFSIPSYASPAEYTIFKFNRSGFVVVAHEDNTQITYATRDSAPFPVNGAQDQELYLSGAPNLDAPQTLTLDAGQVFVYEAESREIDGTPVEVDPSGSIVESDKPISVYGYSSCANVPFNVLSCDYLVESVPPVATWDREYIAPPAANRTYQDTYRAFAWADNTVISLNGEELTTLAAGEYFEYRQRDNSTLVFNGSQPFMLVRYFNGTEWDSQPGDPSMLTMIGTSSGMQTVRFALVDIPGDSYTHSATIVRPRDTAVTLDGTALSDWTAINGTAYDVKVVNVAEGDHVLASTRPLQVYVSGLRTFESYAYPAGINLIERWSPAPLLTEAAGSLQFACRDETDIAVSPQLIELAAGGEATVTITLRNTGTVPAGKHDVLLSLSDGLSVVGSSSSDVDNLGQRAALQNFVLQPNETRSFDVTVRAADSLPTAPLHITELYCGGRVVERIDGVFLGATVAAPVAGTDGTTAAVPAAPAASVPLPTVLPNTVGERDVPSTLLLPIALLTAAMLLLSMVLRRLTRR